MELFFMAEEEFNEEEIEEKEEEELPFAKAEVVRLMKQNLDSDKMITFNETKP